MSPRDSLVERSVTENVLVLVVGVGPAVQQVFNLVRLSLFGRIVKAFSVTYVNHVSANVSG
jgi:hypothetical protein